jgi:hypothetical protein
MEEFARGFTASVRESSDPTPLFKEQLGPFWRTRQVKELDDFII